MGNQAGMGAAANVLGLVHLAANRSQRALDAFSSALSALGAHPRSVRAGDFAMVKANLAWPMNGPATP